MDIYIALCYDRHTDPEAWAFVSREDAIDRAKLFVEENAWFPEDAEEMNIDGYEYFCQYSEEGADYVRVTKSILHGVKK